MRLAWVTQRNPVWGRGKKERKKKRKSKEGTGKEEANTTVRLTSSTVDKGAVFLHHPRKLQNAFQNHHHTIEAGNGPADSSLLWMRVYRHLGYVTYLNPTIPKTPAAGLKTFSTQ